MTEGIKETHFNFANQTHFYKGKVRDVYYFGDKIAMVATDRISAFDVVLPKAIPCKGMILNTIASKFLNSTKHIVPNWFIESPHPQVSIGYTCEPYEVEMVVRAYLTGHAWREYNSGKRVLCGVKIPDGMNENDAFPTPIITPTTKAKEGHDEDISREDIIKKGIVSEAEYVKLEQYSLQLFAFGTQKAKEQNLILVDTKYEFGKRNGVITLIDEIHTPDSSRYFYEETYQERQQKKEPQKQLSKEFVRQWLIENGFQGKEGQDIPEMTTDKVKSITNRYSELFKNITGEDLKINQNINQLEEIEKSINKYFNS